MVKPPFSVTLTELCDFQDSTITRSSQGGLSDFVFTMRPFEMDTPVTVEATASGSVDTVLFVFTDCPGTNLVRNLGFPEM